MWRAKLADGPPDHLLASVAQQGKPATRGVCDRAVSGEHVQRNLQVAERVPLLRLLVARATPGRRVAGGTPRLLALRARGRDIVAPAEKRRDEERQGHCRRPRVRSTRWLRSNATTSLPADGPPARNVWPHRPGTPSPCRAPYAPVLARPSGTAPELPCLRIIWLSGLIRIATFRGVFSSVPPFGRAGSAWRARRQMKLEQRHLRLSHGRRQARGSEAVAVQSGVLLEPELAGRAGEAAGSRSAYTPVPLKTLAEPRVVQRPGAGSRAPAPAHGARGRGSAVSAKPRRSA